MWNMKYNLLALETREHKKPNSFSIIICYKYSIVQRVISEKMFLIQEPVSMTRYELSTQLCAVWDSNVQHNSTSMLIAVCMYISYYHESLYKKQSLHNQRAK